MIIDIFYKKIKEFMKKSFCNFLIVMNKIQTNRVSTKLIDNLKINYYGSNVFINKLATISIENFYKLKITPFNSDAFLLIKKKILSLKSDFNLLISNKDIYINFPLLTLERRKNLVKIINNETECGRVSIRNIRKSANIDLKRYLKKKTINEDDKYHLCIKIQKLTDLYISMINEKSKNKISNIIKI